MHRKQGWGIVDLGLSARLSVDNASCTMIINMSGTGRLVTPGSKIFVTDDLWMLPWPYGQGYSPYLEVHG